MWRTVCLFTCVCHCLAQKDVVSRPNTKEYSVQHLNNNEDFKDFINQQGVNCMYFFKPGSERGANRQKMFLKHFGKSARLLGAYGVQFGLVDCEKDNKVESYCSKEKVEDYVYSFKNGHELLKLKLNTMFDVDSIVSNILQIVLLRELPIVQSLEERLQLEDKAKGQNDIIFSYQKAIGTYEHRILGEVTFAYQSKYNFGLTTEDVTVDDLEGYSEKDDAAIWILRCSILEAGSKDRCPVIKYRGNMDLASLARFIRVIEMPLIHVTEKDGDYNPYPDNELHTVIIYYDDESYEGVMEEATTIKQRFWGVIGILMINVNVPTLTKFGFPPNLRVPALAVKLVELEELHFMPYEHSAPVSFVNSVLMGTIKDLPELTEEGEIDRDNGPELNDHYSMLRDIEREDDPVAIAAMKLKQKPLNKEHIQILTDKTFPVVTTESQLVVVLFYITFDARSMVFLHSYIKSSELLSSLPNKHLATVDCYDWTDVCAKYNVTKYPSLRIYRKDKSTVEYNGMLSTPAIINTVQLYLSDSPVMLDTAHSVKEFMNGQLPENIGQHTELFVLGLYNIGQTKEIETLKKVAELLQGKAVFGLAIGEPAIQTCGLYKTKPNSIVLYKSNDDVEPHSTMNTGLTSVNDIISFLVTSKLPVFPEITTSSFPELMRLKLPFAILFDDGTDIDLHKTIGSLSIKEQYKNKIIISWMHVPNPESVGSQVLMTYNPSASIPALSVVDHASGYIYNYDNEDFSVTVVEQWLNGVLQGEVTASNVLNNEQWKPKNPGYDFLKMMDEQKQNVASEEAPSDVTGIDEESLEIDDRPPSGLDEYEDEIRSELLSLKNSRLFHTADDKIQHKHRTTTLDVTPNTPDVPTSDASASTTSDYSHTEL